LGDIVYGDFEWDEEKARYNLHAHGVSFLEAMTVFDDPLAVVKESRKHSLGEYRHVIIGMSGSSRLHATHTPRRLTRIISARKLTARERRDYESQTEEF
jgi:uncharacterized DUF497 family protein